MKTTFQSLHSHLEGVLDASLYWHLNSLGRKVELFISQAQNCTFKEQFGQVEFKVHITSHESQDKKEMKCQNSVYQKECK